MNKILIGILILTVILFGGCASRTYVGVKEGKDTGKAVNEMYSILGYISEYMGRNMSESYIETLYPHETKIADKLEVLIRRYEQNNNASDRSKREVGVQGHIHFSGKWMSGEINKYYKSSEYGDWTIDQDFILNGNEREIDAYISSVLERDGDGGKKNLIYLANASSKAETISKALIKSGSDWVVVYQLGGIPVSYCIHFSLRPLKDKALIPVQVSEEFGNRIMEPWRQYGTKAQQGGVSNGENGALFTDIACASSVPRTPSSP